MCVSQQSGAEMDSCRVVGPRGLCRPLDEKQGSPTNTSPVRVARKQSTKQDDFLRRGGGFLPRRIWAGAGQAGQHSRPATLFCGVAPVLRAPGRAGRPLALGQEAPRPWNLPGWGPRPPLGRPKNPNGAGLSSSTGRLYPPSPF